MQFYFSVEKQAAVTGSDLPTSSNKVPGENLRTGRRKNAIPSPRNVSQPADTGIIPTNEGE